MMNVARACPLLLLVVLLAIAGCGSGESGDSGEATAHTERTVPRETQQAKPATKTPVPASEDDAAVRNYLSARNRSPEPIAPAVAKIPPLKRPAPAAAPASAPAPASASTAVAVVDSQMNVQEALADNSFPKSAVEQQALVDVTYYGFDGQLHQGQVVVREDLADNVRAVFKEIEQSHFPIAKAVPIVKYGWSDDDSVNDDNTSGFNYRRTPGKRFLSHHSYGTAIDLNPKENPYLAGPSDQSKVYDPKVPGTFTRNCPVVKAFLRHGWMWGGLWKRNKDYQHFEYKE
jgi:hypothetical protein